MITSCTPQRQALRQATCLQYYGLDFMKLFSAILVIGSHTGLFSGNPSGFLYTLYSFFLGTAVPFFALTSGYLLACKLNFAADFQEQLALLRHHVVSLIRLYLLWNLIYLPISVYEFFAVEKPMYLHIIRYVINLIFVGEHYLSWQLWYLLASIYGFSIIYLFTKSKQKNWLIGLTATATLLFANWMFDYTASPGEGFSLRLIISEVFMDGRLFTGIAYVLFGFFFANLPKVPRLPLCAGVLGLGFLAHTVGFTFPCGYSNFLANMAVYSALFFLVVRWNGISLMPLSLKCRRASTVFYFTHMIWFFIGPFIFSRISDLVFWDLPAFLWCLALSSLTALVLERYKNTPIIKQLF